MSSLGTQGRYQRGFTTIWDTRNQGIGDSLEVVLPLRGNYTVEWVEISNPSNKGVKRDCVDNVLLSFESPGVYKLTAYGNIKTMNFEKYTTDTIPQYGRFNAKLLSVIDWGNIEWESFDSFFYKCTNFKIETPEPPNLKKVKSFKQSFCKAKNFNDPLGHWDMSSAEDLSFMFYDAKKFNQSIESWDVSNVTNTHSMFGWAYAFDKPLGNWDVSNVSKMLGMFNHATKFNQPIDSWNVENVKTMSGMFDGATSFNQPLNSWDISNVNKTAIMFMNAHAFNQPLDNWDVSNIRTNKMAGMFWSAKSFDQTLEKWKISNDCDIKEYGGSGKAKGMFSDSGISDKNLVRTLTAWGRTELIKPYTK